MVSLGGDGIGSVGMVVMRFVECGGDYGGDDGGDGSSGDDPISNDGENSGDIKEMGLTNTFFSKKEMKDSPEFKKIHFIFYIHFRNTDFERFFCCPFNTSPQPPTIIPGPAAPRNEIIPSEDECGSSLRSNVVGGEATEAGDWPWLAAIGQRIGSNGFIPFCGATLITKQHVISAAHCFNQERSNTIVRLGEYNTSVVNAIDKAEDFTIADRRMADYNRITKENDLILLKLDRPIIVFKDSIRPACLPYHLRNEPFEGETLMVVGWGKFDVDFDVPRQANVEVIPVKECQRRYKNNKSYKNIIDERQLCAGKGDIDYWVGGSGAPLNFIDISKGRFYVAGIVSFDPRNGNNKLPRVYTRIGSYLDWIDEKIRENVS
ncbi:unnamed protein product, partial [Meganyctiphanes norvegica]